MTKPSFFFLHFAQQAYLHRSDRVALVRSRQDRQHGAVYMSALMLLKKPCSVVSDGGQGGRTQHLGGLGWWRHTGEILRVGLVMAKPVLAVGDTVQVPGSGQQGLVPC